MDSFRIGTLRGCDIKVHPLFVAVILLAALTGYLQVFLLAFALVILHEGCHALAARAFGYGASEIVLLPFGGVARIDGMFESNPAAEVVIAAAGPASNLLLMMAAITLDRYLPLPPNWVRLFVEANLGIAAVNLLPALPLDGGRIVRGFLAQKLDIVRVTRACAVTGVMCAVLMLLVFAWSAAQGTINLSVGLIALFLLLAALREYREAPLLLVKGFAGKRANLKKQGTLPVRQLVTHRDTTFGSVARRFSPGFYHYVTVMDEQCNPIGSFHEEQLLDMLVHSGAGETIGSALSRREKTPQSS